MGESLLRIYHGKSEFAASMLRYLFVSLFAVLFIGWILGFIVFHVAGALIHLLFIFAVVSLLMHLFTGRPAQRNSRP
jgi:hypothetical protein